MRAPRLLSQPPHRATTRHVRALYPFMPSRPLRIPGVYQGRDVYGGGAFTLDHWRLYQAGIISGLNVIQQGMIGARKSTLAKVNLWRGAEFGIQAFVCDPKPLQGGGHEYQAVTSALDCHPISLRPRGSERLNPFDPGHHGGEQMESVQALDHRRAHLLATLASYMLGRRLTPTEKSACRSAVRRVTGPHGDTPTIPQVVDALHTPDADAAAAAGGISVAELREKSRDLALEVAELVDGDLQGMFDGPTTVDMDPDAPIVTLDLSAVYNTPAQPLVMTCATSWLQSAMLASGAGRRRIVIDEAWSIMRDLATVRWLQATAKLSRSMGVQLWAILHQFEDLNTAGDDGSEIVKIVRNFIADCETQIIGKQPADVAAHTAANLGLSHATRRLITDLPRGTHVIRLGTRTHVVEVHVGPAEWDLVDTDHALRTGSRSRP